jgi:hypothetical protein
MTAAGFRVSRIERLSYGLILDAPVTGDESSRPLARRDR